MTWSRWPEEEEQVGVLPVWPRSPLGTQSCHLLRTGVEEGDGLDSCAREGGKLSVRSRYQPKYKPPLGWRLAGTPGAPGKAGRARSRHPAPRELLAAVPLRRPSPAPPPRVARSRGGLRVPSSGCGERRVPPQPSGRGSGDTGRRDRTAGDAGPSQE